MKQFILRLWSRSIHRCLTLFSGLALASASSVAGAPAGDIEWPADWVVFTGFESDGGILRLTAEVVDGAPTFLPLDRNMEGIAVAEITAVPTQVVDAGGQVYEGTPIRLIPGRAYDLDAHFEERKLTDVAWLFAEIESPEAQAVTIGFGADWWFTAWVNGKLATATASSGNHNWPPTANDHTATIELPAGRSIVAVRVVTGRRSALFTAGGPREIRAELTRLASLGNVYYHNTGPLPFDQRIPFPLDEQAIATASLPFEFPAAGVDLAAGHIAGVEPLPVRQRYAYRTARGTPQVLDTENRSFPDQPLKLLLSKSVYPATDLHLDAVLWITPPSGVALSGEIVATLRDSSGTAVASDRIEGIAPTGWFFSMGLPAKLTGSEATLEVAWLQNGRKVARTEQPFAVAAAAEKMDYGSIAILLPNPDGVVAANYPQTIGIPFPPGALYHEENLRLVDESGRELPLQTKITARWSRFGAIKWLLCDFSVDLDGGERHITAQFGPDIRRQTFPDIVAAAGADGTVRMDAGLLQIDDRGLSFAMGGEPIPLLDLASLRGGFVEHASGTRFIIPADAPFTIEELGPVKVVLRTAGWFESADGNERFCNAVSRLVFFRDSPLVRIFHTWIFTGDSREDRIAEMGWDFSAIPKRGQAHFLLSFDEPAWHSGDTLVQFDFDEFSILPESIERQGRTPGVLATELGAATLYLGVKDFWQNFPNELGIEGDHGFAFRNWPRHNPPAKGEPVTLRNAHRNRYAHEGEVLDFTPAAEYFEDEIWRASSSSNLRSHYWRVGDPDSINAQGVAKTEEMMVFIAPPGQPDANGTAVMRGWEQERLRAVVDTGWVAASGAFGNIHPLDPDNFPLDEAIYAEVIRAPSRWNEALGFYGMWLHGDTPAWDLNPLSGTASLYRMLRRNHHGWPIKWTPYARSGDPELLKLAEAATRNLTDVGFCHFISEDVDQRTGEDFVRTLGRWSVSSIPWVSHSLGRGHARGISEDVDYLLDSYYITGYRRAIDVLKTWMELVKLDTSHLSNIGRGSVANMHVALDTYKATFDPWFLIAAHEIASLHREDWSPEGDVALFTDQTVGHFWKPADYDFYRFTGDARHRDVALNVSASWSSPWAITNSWPVLDVPYIEEAVNAWRLSGNPLHLARASAYVDWANMAVFDGDEPLALKGSNTRFGHGVPLGLFTGYYIQQMPYALKAFAEAGDRPNFAPNPFHVNLQWGETREREDGSRDYPFTAPTIWLQADDTKGPMIIRLACQRYDDGAAADWQLQARGSDARIASGEWQMDGPTVLSLDAVTGPLQLTISGVHPNRWRPRAGATDLTVPVAPPDVREVIELPVDERGVILPGSALETQFWFHVPTGTRSFWIDVRRPQSIVRRTIWGPDGQRVWDYDNNLTGQHSAAFIRAEIKVEPGMDGKLWHLSAPGRDNVVLRIDPAIPPFLSVSKDKWFDPRPAAGTSK